MAQPIFKIPELTDAATVAIFDPRLRYVVVQSHDERFEMGQVLAVS